MSVEDRLRATADAVTGAMRPVRPLDLQPDPADAKAPAKPRPPRPPRRWSGWLIPLATAAAVIAVAATLVAVRSLTATGPGSRPTPAATSTAPPSSSVPRYYVDLGPMGSDGRPTQNAVLGDKDSGKPLATYQPPSNYFFPYTAAAANDKTFALLATPLPIDQKAGQPPFIWYVLHLSAVSPQRARLTRVPIAALPPDTSVIGLAVSPDGGTVAVLFQVISHVGGKRAVTYGLMLRTYSLATGQALRTWTDPAGTLSPTGPGTFNVSWLDDGRTVAFMAATHAVPEVIRFLNTTSPGTSLVSDSRPVVSPPADSACGSLLLVSDGKTFVCGGSASDNNACLKGQMDVTAYSVATGKLERVLYRYRGGCQPDGTVQLMWAESGTLAIGAVYVGSAKHNLVGLMTPGNFTSLPLLSNGDAYNPGTIAF